ncbi:MAG TPA: GTPase HflX [Bacteroidales bacterium]|jgi:GTP-binding protein HflX|nr:GTPase HflX [Bacteroidales bacterium]MBP9588551.1 GTPase HflX [Bacteroidales bacterium]NMD15844.1 GTPase HflX [Bacteroidales bacterium]HOE59491.1 GTPase HflX [Bacteroidales bacterium]HOR05256.1 GTPase HflX [Bacteroidales bacterium]
MIERVNKKETAVLIGLITPEQPVEKLNEYLDELEFLADTAGADVRKRFVQRLPYPDPRTFVGKGKLKEVFDYVVENAIDLIIFDDELTASQLRNLDRELPCKILDRNNLILDIFAHRARTSHAIAQVELAQYEYMLPRLARMWTHLEKQRGGIGLRGPGEKEIETDRRLIRKRIALLKNQLEQIDQIKQTQRKSRTNLVRVALVGYTNVGKSTLMNVLSKSSVFAEDKLFATLDTTVRRVVIDRTPFLLSDTVGFIRKLPHSLIESFKSTLDEVREADILLHVADVSHPALEEQIEIVKQTLMEIGIHQKNIITLLNKADLLFKQSSADDLTSKAIPRWIIDENQPCLLISAVKQQGTQQLKEILAERVRQIYRLRYPFKTRYDDLE